MAEKRNSREIAVLRVPAASIWSVEFSPDQTTLATIGLDQSVVLWDLRSRRIITKIRDSEIIPNCIAYRRDGLLVTANTNGVVSLREARSFRETKVVAATHPGVVSLAVAPQGGILALGFANGEIILVDQDSGRQRARVVGHTGSVKSLLFGCDGKVLASAGSDTAVRLWDLPSGRLLKTYSGHRSTVRALALTADGGTLATASSLGGDVILWDVSTARQLRSFTIPDHFVASLVFCRGGRTLAAGCGSFAVEGQGSIHLRDVATGASVAS